MSASNLLQSPSKIYRGLEAIPLVVTWSGGTPSVTHNPLNEVVSLTDNGTGDVTITLADASIAPLLVGGAVAVGTNEIQLVSAPTTTVVRLLCELDDGTATDPTEVHLLIFKAVSN